MNPFVKGKVFVGIAFIRMAVTFLRSVARSYNIFNEVMVLRLSGFKNYWKSLSLKGKSLRIILAIVPTLLIFAVIAWALSLHGTYGLYKVDANYRHIFYYLMIFGVASPFLLALAISARESGKIRRLRFLRLAFTSLAWFILMVGIILPLAIFAVLNILPARRAGDKPPQLLLADGTGRNGVPNMAVVFWTQSATANTFTWGTGDEVETIGEDHPSRQHAFMLRDLLPDTLYWYRVNDEGSVWFNTPPVSGKELKFAVGSDTHFGAASSQTDQTLKILDQIADPFHGFDLCFILGDFVQYGFQDSYWRQGIEAFSPYTSIIPTRFLPGNHDTLFGGTKLYEEYLYPDGMELQTGSRLWYRIDVGDVHFFLLDLEWGTESYTAEQKTWLERELSTIPNEDWTIVMSHCFYYSSGVFENGSPWYDNQEMIKTFSPLFEEHDVDLVFSGHNHHMEALKKGGVFYTVAGVMGEASDPVPTYDSPQLLWYMIHQMGFVEVTISGDVATITFRDPDYNELKSYTVSK